MQLVNTSARYGIVSQTLHWTIAALAVALIVMGKAGDVEAEAGNSLYFWHASLGLLVLFLVLVRIVWRFVTPVPKHPATMPRLAGRAAAGLHFLFYILLVALPLSGWLASSAEGAPVSFFGVATLPTWTLQASPAANTGVAEAGEGGEEFFEEAHEVLGNVLLLLVVLHALAALKHHFVDKDDVLVRMLPQSGKVVRPSDP